MTFHPRFRSALGGLCLLAAAARLHAEGSPPLITDDPGTPGDGQVLMWARIPDVIEGVDAAALAAAFSRLDAFPLTGSGKIQKFKLRERWAAVPYRSKLTSAGVCDKPNYYPKGACFDSIRSHSDPTKA